METKEQTIDRPVYEFDIETIITPCVYFWKRGEEFLYIGMSMRGMARVFDPHHQAIGKNDTVGADDLFEVYFHPGVTRQELLKIENDLIAKHRPKFNQLGEVPWCRNLSCLRCGVRFMQKRWWQHYCNDCSS